MPTASTRRTCSLEAVSGVSERRRQLLVTKIDRLARSTSDLYCVLLSSPSSRTTSVVSAKWTVSPRPGRRESSLGESRDCCPTRLSESKNLGRRGPRCLRSSLAPASAKPAWLLNVPCEVHGNRTPLAGVNCSQSAPMTDGHRCLVEWRAEWLWVQGVIIFCSVSFWRRSWPSACSLICITRGQGRSLRSTFQASPARSPRKA